MEMILKIHLSRSSNSCKIVDIRKELQRGQIRAFGRSVAGWGLDITSVYKPSWEALS
jgi:hypothetical protein